MSKAGGSWEFDKDTEMNGFLMLPPILTSTRSHFLSFMASSFSLTTIILLYCALLSQYSSQGRVSIDLISPNFTASRIQFIDSEGAFLASRNRIFIAALWSTPLQQSSHYLSILHFETNTVIWSANRNLPISSSGRFHLTANGISISHDDGSLVWSTPPLKSTVSALRLLENGNLVLVDQSNSTLWQSFDYPTDTILIDQPLRMGASLVSAISDTNFSAGDYQFSLINDGAVLRWKTEYYWTLSMDLRAIQNSNNKVSYMQMNGSGLYLLSSDGVAVWEISLPSSDFRIARLDFEGRFSIFSFSGGDNQLEFVAPDDRCRLPLACGSLGFCQNFSSSCFCLSGFHMQGNSKACSPSDGSVLPFSASCNSDSSLAYFQLGREIGYYFINFFLGRKVDSFSECQDLCSKNCSCLGFFYSNSSASCYLLKGELGSFHAKAKENDDEEGYIKTLRLRSSSNTNHTNQNKSGIHFPILAFVLLLFLGAFSLAILVGFLWRRRSRKLKTAVVKLGRQDSWFNDLIPMAGLPVRFEYKQLEAATNHFTTLIGSGGFGSVYMGTLPDKTLVAIKKINDIGVRGKKEFYTEIAIIGKIRHANLVRLKGFHAQGGHRFLVLEYMNRGSLDRSLFGAGPVLDWQERMNIAIGAARGLAYLHSGCEHKIIHLDVKPENILLDDSSRVKISDFGLSKLMSPEQSRVYTVMRGTRGYIAPEWLIHSPINDKIDVYSYGMVVLEIVGGRRNCSFQRQRQGQSREDTLGSFYFPKFALEMHGRGQYLGLVDPRLGGNVNGEEVDKLVRIALCCLHKEPERRPSMNEVVAMLEGKRPLGEPKVQSLNYLRFYARRCTESEMLEDDGSADPVSVVGAASLRTSPSPSRISSQQLSGPR